MTAINAAASPASFKPVAQPPADDFEKAMEPMFQLWEAVEALPPDLQAKALGLLEGIVGLPTAEQEARFAQLDAIFGAAQAAQAAPVAPGDAFEAPAAKGAGMPQLA